MLLQIKIDYLAEIIIICKIDGDIGKVFLHLSRFVIGGVDSQA